jgi:hypothetical protein
MGVYHPLDGVTNLKYKLLYFLTPNKKISKRKALAFNRDRCCHLAICLQLILFHLLDILTTYSVKKNLKSKYKTCIQIMEFESRSFGAFETFSTFDSFSFTRPSSRPKTIKLFIVVKYIFVTIS